MPPRQEIMDPYVPWSTWAPGGAGGVRQPRGMLAETGRLTTWVGSVHATGCGGLRRGTMSAMHKCAMSLGRPGEAMPVHAMDTTPSSLPSPRQLSPFEARRSTDDGNSPA
jgi:hypothetical protein